MITTIQPSQPASLSRRGRSRNWHQTLCVFFLVVACLGTTFWFLQSPQASAAKSRRTQEVAPDGGLQAWSTPEGQPLPKVYEPGQLIVRLKPASQVAPKVRALEFESRLTALQIPVQVVRPAFEDLAERLATGQTLNDILQTDLARFPKQKARVAAIDPALQVSNLKALAETMVVEVDKETDIEAACAKLEQSGLCVYAEPNWRAYTFAQPPNDPYYSSRGTWKQSYDDLWGLKNISALDAWDKSTGKDIVIAIVDTGIDYLHPDLAANIWKNTKEIPNNGIDDDRNGFIDDYLGWDFSGGDIDRLDDADNDPRDSFGHGTHVAGIAAGVGNNGIGVVGVAYEAKLMAVKTFPDRLPYGSLLEIARGVEYAAQNGADVINCSLGGPRIRVMEDACALAETKGVVVVVSAGNNRTSTESVTPAEIGTVVTVAALGPSQNVASFSNFGPKLDVAAPGSDVLSCLAENAAIVESAEGRERIVTASDGTKYLRLSGTSMAAPHVSGIAALVRSRFPFFTNQQIRQVLKSSTDLSSQPIPQKFSLQLGYGRISASSAIRQLERGNPVAVQLTSPTPYKIYFNSDQISVSGTATGIEFESYLLQVGVGESPTTWTQLATSLQPAVNKELTTWKVPSDAEGGTYTFRLIGFNRSGGIFIDQASILLIRDKELIEGWPSPLGGYTLSNPAVADLNGDGKMEVIVEGLTVFGDGRIYVMDANGQPFSDAWPKAVNQLVQGTPTIADLDGDGRPEIIVAGYYPGPVIYAYHVSGEPAAGFPVQLNNFNTISSFPLPTPTAADIDGDNRPELLAIGGGFTEADPPELVVINGSGQVRFSVPIYPVAVQQGENVIGLGACSPMVGDITGDSSPEIIVGYTRAQNNTASVFTTYIAYSNQGKLIRGWPITLGPNDFESSFVSVGALADLTGDGKLDFVACRDPKGEFPNPQTYAFRGDGRPIAGWPKMVENTTHIVAPPAVADLNADGKPEIVVRTANQLVVYQADGRYLPGFPVVAASTFAYSQPVIGDIDGDTKPEILFSGSSLTPFTDRNYYLFAVHSDGKPYTGWPKAIIGPRLVPYLWSGFALGDLDGDGKIDGVIPAVERVYAFHFPGAYRPENVPWGTFQQNSQRTGALKK